MQRHETENLEFGEKRFVYAEDDGDGDDVCYAYGVQEPPEVESPEMEGMFGNMVDGVASLNPGDSLQTEDDLCGKTEMRPAEE